jgi:tetratricopeptide (TPR) repeat protein
MTTVYKNHLWITQSTQQSDWKQTLIALDNLLRKYQDVQAIIVSSDEHLVSEKILQSHQAAQRIVVQISVPQHLPQGWLAICNPLGMEQLRSLLDKKTEIKTSSPLAIIPIPTAEKKEGLQLVKKELEIATKHFLGGEYSVVTNVGLLWLNNEAVKKVFSHESIDIGDSQNLLSILACATYHKNIAIEYPRVATTKKSSAATSVFSGVVQKLFAWWQWNVKLPLKSFAQNKDLTNGNHPFYRLLFVSLSFLFLFLLPFLSFDYGMIWDEKIENVYSKDVLNYYLTNGEDTSCFDTNKPLYSHQINYGTFINLVATVANTYFSPFGEYETRHVLVAFLCALGIIFTGRISRLLANPAVGCVAMLCLFFSPHYFGFGMNNHKDIPFAAGYIMSIYYLIRYAQQLPKPTYSILIKLALAIGFTISVRIGGLLLIAYLGLFTGIISWLQLQQSKFKNLISTVKQLALPVVVVSFIAYFLGILFWPWGMQAPFTNPITALTEFTKYSNIKNYELFEGKILFMADKPWYYLPKHIFINTPLFIWAGIALFIALLLKYAKHYNKAILYVLGFVILFPIIYAIYKNANLYNGWRQFIFTYPPMVVFASLGWFQLISLSKNTVYRLAIAAFFAINLGYIANWMIQNHPQQYVYFNETVGGNKGAYGNYELDYYSNSCREAAEWVATQTGSDSILVSINNEPLAGSYYSSRINPNMQVQWVRDYEEQRPNWDYLILTTRTFSKNELTGGAFPPKGTVYTVMCGGAPICAVVKRENTFMPDGYKFIDKQMIDSAILCFSLATQYNPYDEEAWRMLGNAYAMRMQYDSAIFCLDKSIAIFPENYSAYNNKAMVYYNQKDFQNALDLFMKVTKLKINHTESYFYIGLIYLQQNSFAEAAKFLSKGIEQNGSIPELYYYLGYAQLNMGNYVKAENSLKYCLGLSPNNAQAYRLLADVFSKQNKQQEAQFCLQKYRELGGQ